MFVLFYPCFSFRRPPIARTGKKDHGPVPQKPFRLITLYGGARKTVICCVPGVSDRRSDVIYLSCVFTEPDLRLPSQPANFLPNSLARSSAASLPVSACPCSSTAGAYRHVSSPAKSASFSLSSFTSASFPVSGTRRRTLIRRARPIRRIRGGGSRC